MFLRLPLSICSDFYLLRYYYYVYQLLCVHCYRIDLANLSSRTLYWKVMEQRPKWLDQQKCQVSWRTDQLGLGNAGSKSYQLSWYHFSVFVTSHSYFSGLQEKGLFTWWGFRGQSFLEQGGHFEGSPHQAVQWRCCHSPKGGHSVLSEQKTKGT